MPRDYLDVREDEALAEDDGFYLRLHNVLQLYPVLNPLGHPLSIEVRDANGPLFEATFRFVTRH